MYTELDSMCVCVCVNGIERRGEKLDCLAVL